MAGHLLGVLKPSVVLQVDRDTGRTPSVTSDGGEKIRRFGTESNENKGPLKPHYVRMKPD